MILLDTHVLIWLMTTPNRISSRAAEAIAESGEERTRPVVSTASIFEIIYAKRRDRVRLHVSDAQLLEKLRRQFEIHPVTESIAMEAGALGEPFHGDPMDRIIVATAIVQNCALITRDDRIRSANVCRTIW